MIKVIDVDALFEKYISDYVYKNIGKVKPEEIENKIPELYVSFGNEKIKELDGKTPNEYYNSFSATELIECLKAHLEKGVEVSDFLCEALSLDKNESALVDSIKEDQAEEFTLYVMNMLSEIKSDKCLTRYLDFITWDYCEPIKELATEHLRNFAEQVKESVLLAFNQAESKVKEYLTEILSCVTNKDDRVFNILIDQFEKNQNNIPLYSSYIAKYGDERALPLLIKTIENEKINYADFEELRFAIEALGGEYNKVRDFKSDKTFKKIMSVKKDTPLS